MIPTMNTWSRALGGECPLGVGGADVVHAVGGAGLEVARVDGTGGAREAEGAAVVTHDERVGPLGARVPGVVEAVVVVRAAGTWVWGEKRGRQNWYYTPYEGPYLANQKSRKLGEATSNSIIISMNIREMKQ